MPIFANITSRTNPDRGVSYFFNRGTAGASAGHPCARITGAAGSTGCEVGEVVSANIGAFVGVWLQDTAVGAFGPVCVYGYVDAYVMGHASLSDGVALIPVVAGTGKYLTYGLTGTDGVPHVGNIVATYTTTSAALKKVFLRMKS